jgi:hypothetical protein
MESDLIKRGLYSLGALAFLAIFATGSVDSNTSQSSRSIRTPIESATPEIRRAKPVLSSSPLAGQKARDTAKPDIFPLSRIIGQPESIVNKVLGKPDKYHKLPPNDGYQGFGDLPGAIQVMYPDRPTWKAITTVFSHSKLMFIQLDFVPKPMSEEELFTALGLPKANFVVIKSLPGQYGGTQYRGTIDKRVIEIAAWRPTDGSGFCGMVTIELVQRGAKTQ